MKWVVGQLVYIVIKRNKSEEIIAFVHRVCQFVSQMSKAEKKNGRHRKVFVNFYRVSSSWKSMRKNCHGNDRHKQREVTVIMRAFESIFIHSKRLNKHQKLKFENDTKDTPKCIEPSCALSKRGKNRTSWSIHASRAYTHARGKAKSLNTFLVHIFSRWKQLPLQLQPVLQSLRMIWWLWRCRWKMWISFWKFQCLFGDFAKRWLSDE